MVAVNTDHTVSTSAQFGRFSQVDFSLTVSFECELRSGWWFVIVHTEGDLRMS